MKKLFLLYLVVSAAGCFRQQHDERIANNDTLLPHPEKLLTPDSSRLVQAVNRQSATQLLYESKCMSCHRVSGSCRVMPGAIDRIPPGNWKYHWFRNPDSVVAAGEPYAVKIKADWHNQPHPAFPELSRAEIDDLLQYISKW
ncbi:MAG: cytochrome c [Bacteroidetes bacterium]|nr:cytochrome c [Bacteroidota bacterium]